MALKNKPTVMPIATWMTEKPTLKAIELMLPSNTTEVLLTTVVPLVAFPLYNC